MKRFIRLNLTSILRRKEIAILGITLILFCCCTDKHDDNGSLIIKNVNIFDGNSPEIKSNRTIIIREGFIRRIVKTSESSTFEGGRIIDAHGLTAIPALWDMHVHFLSDEQVNQTLFSYGVLYARSMGDDLAEVRQRKREIEAGDLLGPEIIYCGPIFHSSEEDLPWKCNVQDSIDIINALNPAKTLKYRKG